MQIIEKIIAHGKSFAAAAKKEFDAIQSPVVRVSILIIIVVIALMMAWKALPLLIVFGLIAAAVFLIPAIPAGDDDKRP